ncbi:biopolymer transporter ExbD [Thiohalorhabdus sp. Cl-TMA]|uniref:Biopolymer transporter ExbD n=1 Tax=Thiohalorhabdus methylotrophus TaxID=3242694 RepID=A0ABV4TR73_9GAMM
MAYRRRKLMGEINIIPLVDVVLVLLVVFMMTAPMLTRGVDVDLPEASSQPVTTQNEPLEITVREDGVYIQKTRVADPRADLATKVQAILEEQPGQHVLLRGQRTVDYEAVVVTLNLLRQGGIRQVDLVTQPTKN